VVLGKHFDIRKNWRRRLKVNEETNVERGDKNIR